MAAFISQVGSGDANSALNVGAPSGATDAGDVNISGSFKQNGVALGGGGGDGSSVGAAGTLQAADGTGNFIATSFVEAAPGQFINTQPAWVFSDSSETCYVSADSVSLGVMINTAGGSAVLDLNGAWNVGSPSGSAPSTGDVNISGSFKVNGTPIGSGGGLTVNPSVTPNPGGGQSGAVQLSIGVTGVLAPASSGDSLQLPPAIASSIVILLATPEGASVFTYPAAVYVKTAHPIQLME
jgi:hypothetical protein